METDIQDKKIELIQWLTTLEDDSVIQKIVELRKNETKDWYNSVSDAEKASIHLGINDSENGLLNSNSKAKDIYGKWL